MLPFQEKIRHLRESVNPAKYRLVVVVLVVVVVVARKYLTKLSAYVRIIRTYAYVRMHVRLSNCKLLARTCHILVIVHYIILSKTCFPSSINRRQNLIDYLSYILSSILYTSVRPSPLSVCVCVRARACAFVCFFFSFFSLFDRLGKHMHVD